MIGARILILLVIFLQSSVHAENNDHIHIKLHLPDLLKKHTHVRTIYKHHFHPKKTTTHSHLIKDSLGNKFEPESSFSMLNPLFNLPKSNSFVPFNAPTDLWLPRETNEDIINYKGIKPHLKPLRLNSNWDMREIVSKYGMPTTSFESPMQTGNIRGYTEDGTLPSGMKSLDDDEDEEYMMTEDSVHELPLALQMQLKDSDKFDAMMRNKNTAMWNKFLSRPKMPGESPQWAHYMSNEQPFSMGEFDEMQGYESLRNMMQMQGNFESMPELSLKAIKSFKGSNKGKNKKRKRLNMNKISVNSFGYK